MISFGNAASSHSGLIPLKTLYKKEGNCSGRSRVRKILLTCIQLLLLQFLHVIWSTPTNFAIFKKHLIIPRLIVNKYTLQVSRTLKTCKAFKQGLKYNQFFPQILCLHVSVRHYSLALFSSFICMHVCNRQKNSLHQKGPSVTIGRQWPNSYQRRVIRLDGLINK